MASQAEAVVEKLEERLLSNPGSHVFARVADSYRKQGDITRAMEICTRGIEYQPDSITGRLILGRCHLEQENFDSAVDEFKQVCRLDRRNQMAIKMLADIFSKQGLEDKAGDLYSLLLHMEPDNPSLIHLSKIFKGTGKTDLMEILGETLTPPAATTNDTATDPISGTVIEDQHQPSDEQDFPVLEDDTAQDFSVSPDAPAASEDMVTGDDIDGRIDQMFGEEQSGEESSLDTGDMDALFDESSAEIAGLAPNDSSADEGALSEDDAVGQIDSILGGDDLISGGDVSGRLDEMFSDDNSRSDSEQDFTGGLTDDYAAEAISGETGEEPPQAEAYGQDDIQTDEQPIADSPDESNENETFSGDDIVDKIDSIFDSKRQSVGDEPPAVEPEIESKQERTSPSDDEITGEDVSARIEELFESSPDDQETALARPVDNEAEPNDFPDTQALFDYDQLNTIPAADTNSRPGTDDNTLDTIAGDELSGTEEKTPSENQISSLHDSEEPLDYQADEHENTQDSADFDYEGEDEIDYGLSEADDIEDAIAKGKTLAFDRNTLNSLRHQGDEGQLTGSDVEERLSEMFGEDGEECIVSDIQPDADIHLNGGDKSERDENRLDAGAVEMQDGTDEIDLANDELYKGLAEELQARDDGAGETPAVDNAQGEDFEMSGASDLHSLDDTENKTVEIEEDAIEEIPDSLEDTVADDYESNENQPFTGDDVSLRLDSIFGAEEELLDEEGVADGTVSPVEAADDDHAEKSLEPGADALSVDDEALSEKAQGREEESSALSELTIEEPEFESKAEESESLEFDFSDEMFGGNDEVSHNDEDGVDPKVTIEETEEISETAEVEDRSQNDESRDVETVDNLGGENRETREGEYDDISEEPVFDGGETVLINSTEPQSSDDGLKDLLDDDEFDLDSLPAEAEEDEIEPVSEFYSVGGGDAGDLTDEDRELLATIDDSSSDAVEMEVTEIGEPVDMEPADMEPEDMEPEDTEPADTEPADTKPADTEPVDMEPVDMEPVDTEPVDMEPVDMEPVDMEPVDTEPVDMEPVDTEPVDTEPVDTEPVDMEPADTEPVDMEPVDMEPADMEPADMEPADMEPVDTEPVDMEPADTEPEDTEPVDMEPVDTEPVDTEPVDMEPEDMEPVDMEPEDMEPVDMEPADMDPVDTEPVDMEPVDMEPVDMEPVDMEPVDTEPADMEPEDMEPVDTEPEDMEPEDMEPVDMEPEVSRNEAASENDAIFQDDDVVDESARDDTVEHPEFDPEAVPSGTVAQADSDAREVEAADELADLAIPDHVLTPTLADIYYQQGQPLLAVQIYKRLLEKDPDDERIEQRIGQIQKAVRDAELKEKAEAKIKSTHPRGGSDDGKAGGSSPKKSRTRPRASNSKQSREKNSDEEKPLKGVKIKKKVKAKIRKKK